MSEKESSFLNGTNDTHFFFDENEVKNEFDMYETKENTVVVRNLKTIDSKTLASKMQYFGNVTNARSIIKPNSDDSHSNSFGFVTFEYKEDARKSLKAKTFEIDNRIVLILPSPLNDVDIEEENEYYCCSNLDYKRTVFVGNLDLNADADNLKNEMRWFGKVTYARVINRHVRGIIQSRGFGYVQFKTKEEAANAIAAGTIEIYGRRVKIVQARRRKPRITAFLGGVVENTTEEQIEECFPTAKTIIINQPQEGRSGFSYVTFKNEKALLSAIRDVREVNINGAKVIVRITKPKTSSRRKKGRSCYIRATKLGLRNYQKKWIIYG